MKGRVYLIGRVLFKVVGTTTDDNDGAAACETFDLVTGEQEKGIYFVGAIKRGREVAADAIERAQEIHDEYIERLLNLESQLEQ